LLLSLRQEDGQAIATIEDNGCGIEEENISRLFEPYFTQKRNGMGLGLASTLNIVKAHGGFIEVNSEVGKGTTFIVTLPLATGADVP
jgi:signal transduction histidine kinase